MFHCYNFEIFPKCEMNINASCNPDNFPKANWTLVAACNATVNSFEKEAKRCLDLSKEETAEEACTCWTGDDMMKYSEEVKTCKIPEVGDIAKGLKSCKGNVSECRQYEDAAIHSIQLCSRSEDKHLSKIESLSKIKDALTDIKAKITKVVASASASATNCPEMLGLISEGEFYRFRIFHHFFFSPCYSC